MDKPQRIALIGTSGAGKTMLGRIIAERMNVVFVEWDSIRHKSGWKRASAEETRQGFMDAVGVNSSWVIDNVPGELSDLIENELDVILWLDLPLVLKLWRVTKRSFQRILNNEELWNGNFETWQGSFWGKDSLIAYAIHAHFRHRSNIPKRFDVSKTVRLRTPREVEQWLTTSFPSSSMIEL